MLAALIKGTDNLSRPRTDKSEKWLAIAAALGQPTRTGTIGETASNVAGAVGKFKAEQRAEEQKRLTDALTLQKGVYDIVSDEAKADETYQTKVNAALAQAGRPLTGTSRVDLLKNDHSVKTWTMMEDGVPVTYLQDLTARTAPERLPSLLPSTSRQTAGTSSNNPPPPASPLKIAAGTSNNAPPPASPLKVAAADKPPSVSDALAASQPPTKQMYTIGGRRYAEGDTYTDVDDKRYRVGAYGIPEPISDPSTASVVRKDVAVKAGTAAVERQVALQDAAKSAEAQLPNLKEALANLKSGNVITGFGANQRLNVLRAAALAGDKEAARKVEATQNYQYLTGQQVGTIITQFGSGTGLSDSDREFARKLAANEIAIDAASLTRAVKIIERQSRLAITRSTQAGTPQLPAQLPPGYSEDGAIAEAVAAIKSGKDRAGVLRRLRSYGIVPPEGM
jgi:hypothetical protein